MTRAADILAREEELRTLYSELQGITPYGVDKDVYELSRMGYYDLRKFNELVDMLDATELMLIDTKYDYDYDRVSEGSDVLLDWLYELIKQPEIFCARRYPYMICEEMPTGKYIELQNKMREIGINCGLLTEDEREASFVRIVDSFTNCLHSLGLELAEYESKFEELTQETNEVCSLVEEPKSEALIEACKVFAHYVEENEECYHSMDRRHQKGYIYENKIQFDIGGQVGHKAEIDLSKGVFRYYEPDRKRGRAVTTAIENELGLVCEQVYYDEYVCRDVTEDKVVELARLLAFIPSLDIYMDAAVTQYKHDVCEPECEDECVTEGEYHDTCVEICEDSCKIDSEEDEECMSECVLDCVHRACRDDCERYCDESAEDEILNRTVDTLEEVLRHDIDYYCDALNYIY